MFVRQHRGVCFAQYLWHVRNQVDAFCLPRRYDAIPLWLTSGRNQQLLLIQQCKQTSGRISSNFQVSVTQRFLKRTVTDLSKIWSRVERRYPHVRTHPGSCSPDMPPIMCLGSFPLTRIKMVRAEPCRRPVEWGRSWARISSLVSPGPFRPAWSHGHTGTYRPWISAQTSDHVPPSSSTSTSSSLERVIVNMLARIMQNLMNMFAS